MKAIRTVLVFVCLVLVGSFLFGLEWLLVDTTSMAYQQETYWAVFVLGPIAFVGGTLFLGYCCLGMAAVYLAATDD